MNLMDTLASADKSPNVFGDTKVSVCYKTGFPTFDYRLGFKTIIKNKESGELEEYKNLGIAAGSYNLVIGKSSTGKTTWVERASANIVKPFEKGSVLHFDLEQANVDYSRIMAVTGFGIKEIEEEKKYKLVNSVVGIGTMKKSIMEIYYEKMNNKEEWQYHTGVKDIFGKEIIEFQPTVVIIDSLPMMRPDMNLGEKKNREKTLEVGGQTDIMRNTAEIGRFFTEILPFTKEANIIIFAINHIKVNPQMGFIPSPAELLFLDQNEALPCGKTVQYLANGLFKFVAIGSQKFVEEKDGFDGFGVNVKVIKSRTNQNNVIIPMILNTNGGFSSVRTSVDFAINLGIVTGNKNGYYINGDKDHKFCKATMEEDFANDPILFKNLYSAIIPILDKQLSITEAKERSATPVELFDY